MIFGNIVLYSWPVIVAVLFRRCTGPVALLASIIAGYLLLPTQLGVDLPGLPTLNKDSIPAIAAFFAVLMVNKAQDTSFRQGWLPQGILPRILVFVLVAGTFLTVINNDDPLVYGPTVVPALRTWDAFSTILTTLTVLLPFFLGRKLLARPEQQRQILIALVIAGAFYSFLALYEVRMSPQLNNIVYGFFPSSWLQTIRGGGFRPLVFLIHGLWLAIFFSATILAAFGLMRVTKSSQKFIFFCAGLWLLMTLVLSKSLGALAITLIILPVILLLGKRQRLMVAAALAAIVLVYPMLRGAGLIPVERILEWAQGLSGGRAQSFAFRLVNEDILLEKALQRPWFGWGGWGRNFVFNDAGRDISLADGYWILIIGQGGWVRYLAEFGLLCLPPILAFFRPGRYQLGFETTLLMLILAGNLVDLIPNATITPLTWMVAGAIWGRLELGQLSEAGEARAQIPQQSRRLAYSRYAKEMPVAETAPQSPPAPSERGRQRYARQKAPGGQGKSDGFRKPANQ